MRRILGLFTLFALTLCSCGPTEQEVLQHELFLQDSLRRAVIADSLRIVQEDSLAKAKVEAEEQLRIHLEMIEVGKTLKKSRLEGFLVKAEEGLARLKKERSSLSQFKLGRTESEKKQQLEEKDKEIREIELFIPKLKNEIAMTQLFKSFDFQETPKGTLEYLIYAAQHKEYDKMRHLLDPYAQNDGDAEQICWVEMLPSDRKAEWVASFEKGRIMSDPAINGDKAQIEFAFGPSSSKLETMNLVKRWDRWYFLSL
jgi:hypothetical protein